MVLHPMLGKKLKTNPICYFRKSLMDNKAGASGSTNPSKFTKLFQNVLNVRVSEIDYADLGRAVALGWELGTRIF